MTDNWSAALAAELNATVVPNNGDARIVLDGGDFIYAGITGKVRAQIGGHIVTIGTVSTPTDTLVDAYHNASGPVRDADMAALRAGGVG